MYHIFEGPSLRVGIYIINVNGCCVLMQLSHNRGNAISFILTIQGHCEHCILFKHKSQLGVTCDSVHAASMLCILFKHKSQLCITYVHAASML